MTSPVPIVIVSCGALSGGCTWLVLRFAHRLAAIDIPNGRSSHVVPTPRGGGAAIVLVATIGFGVLVSLGGIDRPLGYALFGGLAVALIGLLDDRRPTPASVRLAVQLAAAAWAVGLMGGLPPLRIGNELISFGAAGYVMALMGIVWTMNFFNFMDGIDGIAASEAVFVACASAFIAFTAAHFEPVSSAALLFGATCIGFLVWNWPPAKIFMGDVGSGYIGYVLAVLALAAARKDPVALLVWLILGGAFFVDSTVTLIRRAIRGERLHQAHRIHAYQWLARRWGSHRRTTVATMVLNIVWLLPLAWFASSSPKTALWTTVVALLPVGALALAVGAGREERSSPSATPPPTSGAA